MIKLDLNKSLDNKKKKHIRYGWNPSEEYTQDWQMVNHHFVVNHARKAEINKIKRGLAGKFNQVGPFEVKERLEGKTRNSDLYFSFFTCTSLLSSKELDLASFGVKVIKDSELYDREVLDLANYVSRLYAEEI